MSLFSTATIDCVGCSAPFPFELAESVNADRDPDLRGAILSDAFQVARCPACGETRRVTPYFIYLDLASGLYISAQPADALAERGELAAECTREFDENYGPQAGDAAHDIGQALRPRVTFGWPALREKILIGQAGLDDVAVELLKLDVLRRLPRAPLRRGVELRLREISDANLVFAWMEAATSRPIERFDAPRDLLDSITGNAAGWEALRSALTRDPFVDAQALYLSEEVG